MGVESALLKCLLNVQHWGRVRASSGLFEHGLWHCPELFLCLQTQQVLVPVSPDPPGPGSNVSRTSRSWFQCLQTQISVPTHVPSHTCCIGSTQAEGKAVDFQMLQDRLGRSVCPRLDSQAETPICGPWAAGEAPDAGAASWPQLSAHTGGAVQIRIEIPSRDQSQSEKELQSRQKKQ